MIKFKLNVNKLAKSRATLWNPWRSLKFDKSNTIQWTVYKSLKSIEILLNPENVAKCFATSAMFESDAKTLKLSNMRSNHNKYM